MQYLLTAIPVGVLWLAGTLLMWRRRNSWWSAFGFAVLFFGHKIVQEVFSPEPFHYFLQWLSVVVLIAHGTPSIFRSRTLRLCRLDASNVA
jgi:cytochrome b561